MTEHKGHEATLKQRFFPDSKLAGLRHVSSKSGQERPVHEGNRDSKNGSG